MRTWRQGEKQREILEYIKKCIHEKGIPPSVREIGTAVHLNSTSTVHGHLLRLEKKGLIRRDAARSRSIEVVDDGTTYRRDKNYIPIVGKVTAGLPIWAEENIEGMFPLPDSFIGNHSSSDFFVLHVGGSSMIGAGIQDKDFAIVRKQDSVHNGEIAVVLLDDAATIKRFYKVDEHIELHPENPEYTPIIVRRAQVLGKVVGLFRSLE